MAPDILSGTVPPCGVAIQMPVQVLPAAFKLVTDKPNTVQPYTHGELLVFFLHLAAAGAFLGQRLMVQGERQHDICPDFPGVQRPIKPPKLNRMVPMKQAVQVEEVVTARVVMAGAVSGVFLIPDGLDLLKGFGLLFVQPLHQIGVHLLAVMHPLRRNLKGLIEQVIVRIDDVDEVADASWRMARAVQMDVDAAGMVGKPSGFAEPPCQSLHRVNIFPV